jgi:murein DD-endopeptidase MepM/ murein hydrolase activator NlpD
MFKLLGNILVITCVMGTLLCQAQVESAIELMADTSAWANYNHNVGGATADEASEVALFMERASVDLSAFSFADSLAQIPAFNTYCSFDTKNLFATKMGKELVPAEGETITLIHELCDFHYPTNGVMTSVFGPRWGRMHYGLDIDLETGDNVFAAWEGMVRISQYHSSYGNVVVVRHNNGLETLYAHMSQRKVRPGDHVEAGEVVGLGGNTGRSYGSHLHFEIRYMGDAIDPNLIVDPAKKSIRDWQFTLNKKHFDYVAAEVDRKYVDARKGSNVSKKFHTVKSGETLSSIARKHKTTINALCKLNKLKTSSKIKVGQKLRYK